VSVKGRPVLLAVDDSEDLLALMRQVLSAEYVMLTAANPGDAISLAAGDPRPDLIVLDIEMPDVSGFEVCQALKAEPTTADIPIVFLTGKAEAEAQVEAFGLGAVDYLIKPINVAILKARVQMQIQMANQRQALEGLVRKRTEQVERTRRLSADASHALRTPLTSVRGNLELLASERPDSEPVQEALGQVHRLDRMVSGLLALERLAEHAQRGQLREKAVDYLRRAGAKAAEREAYREAAVLFEQALDALGQLPESQPRLEQAIDLRFDIRNVLQPLGDRDGIASYLRESERLAARLDDPRRIAWVQSYLTEHFWIHGRYDDAAAAGHVLADAFTTRAAASGCKARTGVADLEAKRAALTGSADDHAAGAGVGRDAMNDGVFDQGLQNHAGHDRLEALRVDVVGDNETIGESYPLDAKIAFHQLELAGQ